MDNKAWAEEIWQKCQKKITKTAERIGGKIPYTTKDGKYNEVADIDWWTNSFWAGILWHMFAETQDERFKKWAQEVEDTLNKGGGCGRKLDFIAQEMNREANTILSKANSLEISDTGINLKTDIEKVREQIQNIE